MMVHSCSMLVCLVALLFSEHLLEPALALSMPRVGLDEQHRRTLQSSGTVRARGPRQTWRGACYDCLQRESTYSVQCYGGKCDDQSGRYCYSLHWEPGRWWRKPFKVCPRVMPPLPIPP
ncbi:unnamed protein product [Amoebophrya sp. A25]|nr:unnamed protein product [Amoebophrya sp. A25]|eukprot:GSA25T00008430001.1